MRYGTLLKMSVLCITLVILVGIVMRDNKHKEVSGNTDAEANVGKDRDRSYAVIPTILDPEQRTKRLRQTDGNDPFDLSALAGMGDGYAKRVSSYIETLVDAIQVTPLMRQRFYQEPEEPARPNPYPDSARPVYDKDVVVPLSLLPRPEAVRVWSSSKKASESGWRSEEEVAEHRGSVYGRTVIFKAGEQSVNPSSFPASPFGTVIPSWNLYVSDQDSTFFLALGKVVLTPDYELTVEGAFADRADALGLGKKGGAQLLGEMITVPPYLKNRRLRWASIRNGSSTRRFLAYSLLDGNGARRMKISEGMLTAGGMTPYVRPLQCNQHQPRINRHDELLLPLPIGWPPTRRDQAAAHVDDTAHEEWCLDDWFPAQKDACWVIREAEDSQPLQESFLLMPASEKSDRPVFFIALFAETEPKQLIQELTALYKVSPDKALNSPETMARLQSLYEKIRDFPLDK